MNTNPNDFSTTIEIPTGYREIKRTTVQKGDRCWNVNEQCWTDISSASIRLRQKVSQIGRVIRPIASAKKTEKDFRKQKFNYVFKVLSKRDNYIAAVIELERPTKSFIIAQLACKEKEALAILSLLNPAAYRKALKLPTLEHFHCRFSSDIRMNCPTNE